MTQAELRALGAGDPLSAARFGLKAAWLDRALRSGERVPAALALSARFAQRIAGADRAARQELGSALAPLLHAAHADVTLAVRASPDRSVPGALLTRLGVAPDLEAVVAVVAEVVASAQLAHVQAQLGAALPDEPWVGVLIQIEVRFAAADVGAVVFTHDPRSGEPGVRGEYARGGLREVVSGRGHPLPLSGEKRAHALSHEHADAFHAMEVLATRLAQSFDQPLELELGFAAGSLWLLQVRALVLTSRALVRVALAAIEADSPRYAHWLSQLAERGLGAFSEQHFSEQSLSGCPLLMRGVAASPGAAVGVVVTDVARALERAPREPVVLLRPDAIPEDVAAFRAAVAVVTSSGGLTCHAAVIARGLAKPAVVGVSGVRIDVARGLVYGGRDTREVVLKEGDWVSVDARAGTLHRGRAELAAQLRDAELKHLFAEVRKLRPTPLWVAGEAVLALRLKADASLDGALCTWPERGGLPTGSGRECWVELDAREVAERLPDLPAGWGVVVYGDLRDVKLAELRALAPLRAFGVRWDAPEDVLPEGALDLLVVAFTGDIPPQKREKAARLLRMMNFPERAPVPSGNNVGWVCPASHAALTALRYAALRANRTAISLADEGEP